MYARVLVDDLCGKSGLTAEHGLSILLETPRGTILMDTGQGGALMHNAGALGVDLERLDHIVLSHGHYDHTWGLPALLHRTGKKTLWAHPGFSIPRFRTKEGKTRFIGTHLAMEAVTFQPVTDMEEIVDGVWAMTVPREERDPDMAPLDCGLRIACSEGTEPDPFDDDLSLVIRGRRGLSIVTGCAHAGIANILERAARLFDTRHFALVMGGLHLSGQTDVFVKETLTTLKDRFTIDRFRPCHCTGPRAFAAISAAYDDVDWISAGRGIEI